MPRATQVFTPNDVPTYTYVDRSAHHFEESVREALEIPKLIISLSGPSKSGKTVLVKKVVERTVTNCVSGASIRYRPTTHGAKFWLGWRPPLSVLRRCSNPFGGSAGVSGGGEVGSTLGWRRGRRK